MEALFLLVLLIGWVLFAAWQRTTIRHLRFWKDEWKSQSTKWKDRALSAEAMIQKFNAIFKETERLANEDLQEEP